MHGSRLHRRPRGAHAHDLTRPGPAQGQGRGAQRAAGGDDVVHQPHAQRCRERLARLDGIHLADAAPEGAVQIVIDGAVFALPLAGVIDLAAERLHLTKGIAKIVDDEIAKYDKKLGNEAFLAKAPAEVVAKLRERKAEAERASARLTEALNRLPDD